MVEVKKYSFATKVRTDLPTARERVIEALAREGFGVLTEIDVAATLKKKLGLDVRPYVILGACNPPLAHKALEAEPEIGVLLPCNVVLWANEDGTCAICALDPVRQFSLVGNSEVEPVAHEVHARLTRVLEAVAAQLGA
jgi:uncharacterized protein (DUF302 family)